MTREELNECKKVIDEFFGEGALDGALSFLNVSEEDLIDKESEPVHVLPSEKLHNIDKKLELHKLVQEYVTEENISNDDYAKLFEFACWIINR